jgi:manganese/iron transport system permease protein
MSDLLAALLTAGALGISCAVLSVFVVLRRWALLGECVAHAGLGGAGTAWMLSLLGFGFFAQSAGVHVMAAAFCMVIALGIAQVTRRGNIESDLAMGIFLVASVAWGLLGRSMYVYFRGGVMPTGWDEYLLGELNRPEHALAAAAICAVTLLSLWALRKEAMFYTLDPEMAEISGVPVGLVHFGMILLLGILIVLGMRMIGTLLISALLVLPGAAGLRISQRFGAVIAWSAGIGLSATVIGLLVHRQWKWIPSGPVVVLVLTAAFAAAAGWRAIADARRRSRAA